MQASPRIEAFIKGWELCRLRAFRPTRNDVPTIGWGATGPDVQMGMVWTQLQADTRFDRDIAAFAAGVTHLIDGRPTTQGQFDACLSLSYNIGIKSFTNSTLLKLHRAGNKADAADQFLCWNKQAGKVLNGLTRRRTAERQIYLEADR